ncbi:MAG: DnaJ domain-containing protein [Myxococcota bacterium]
MPDGSEKDRATRIPRLGASADPTALVLSPTEGFLLSRIDGATPWGVLRAIGGLTPDEVDARLEAWLEGGILELVDPAARRPKRRLAPGEIDEDALDESLGIDLDTQRRILEFESRLGAAYHDLLGVARDADAKEIKRAYFKLSKEFHPDRYFRREIGGYAKRLEAIFKRILEAYELLSDPTARAEVEKSMSAAAGARPQPAAPVASEGDAPTAPPRPLTKLERLRARMPFKLPESVFAERRQRAREFFDAAQKELARNRFIEAAQTIRLAIAFDPFEDAYRERFGEVQARAAELRAEALVAEAEEATTAGGIADEKRYAQVLRLYEEALLYRPHDPALNDRAARAAIQCKQLTKAVEYAETALAHSPDVAQHHVTMALVHRARGNRGHAINALEQALSLDKGHDEGRKLLAVLRRAAGAGG